MLRKFTLIVSFFLFAVSFWQVLTYASSADKITVEADGSGDTKMAAMKDAWVNAVRKAVGMYMVSASSAASDGIDDKYTEEIATYSRGQVNSFETLSESHEDGIWKIKIKANIEKDILEESIGDATSKRVKVNGANLAARAQSVEDKKNEAENLLKISNLFDFNKCLEYSPSLQTFNIEGRENVFMRHELKMNLEKFKKQSDELEKLVAQIAISKRNVSIVAELANKLLKSINKKDINVPIDSTKEFGHNSIVKIKVADSPEIAVFYPNAMSVYKPSQHYHNLIKIIKYDQWGSIRYNFKEEPKNDICFLRNASSAMCYKLSDIHKDMLLDILKKGYEFKFFTNSGTSYDSIIAASTPYYFIPRSHLKTIFLGVNPALLMSTASDNGKFYHPIPAGVFILYQKLDLSVEELADMKELEGKYEINPIKIDYLADEPWIGK